MDRSCGRVVSWRSASAASGILRVVSFRFMAMPDFVKLTYSQLGSVKLSAKERYSGQKWLNHAHRRDGRKSDRGGSVRIDVYNSRIVPCRSLRCRRKCTSDFDLVQKGNMALRSVFKLGWCSFLASVTPSASAHLLDSTDTFDYIVVGGGTSGLVVANRLSEDENGTNRDDSSRPSRNVDRLLTTPDYSDRARRREWRHQHQPANADPTRCIQFPGHC